MTGFLSLPRELRYIIYNHVIKNPSSLWLQSHRLNILQTCRTIYNEAVAVFYKDLKFHFHLMSTTKPSPTLSQEVADLMQNIHIKLGSDFEKLQGSLDFLRLFTGSAITRDQCFIQSDMDQPHAAEATVPALRLLKGFTGFRIVAIEMDAEGLGFRVRWHEGLNDVDVRAGYVWRNETKELQALLGTAYKLIDYNYRYMEFWPRNYLKQKARFSSKS